MTNTRYCANCLAHQPVDTLTAQACERATIPAREFCGSCGYFFGYIECGVVPPPQPAFLAPVVDAGGSFAEALWKYASRLAGGVW